MEITTLQKQAAASFVDLVVEKFGHNGEIEPATAINAAARLAGSFMFRSFGLPLQQATPGSAVLSDIANERGPALMNVLGGALDSYGIQPDPQRMQTAAPVEPAIPFLDTLARLQDPSHEIMLQHQLTFEQMAFSCAIAAAFIVKNVASQLAPETGFQTAVYGFVEGTKTWPSPLAGN